MPTYLDQHICLQKDAGTFQPGNRWQDAAQCKEHFEKARQSVLDKSDPPFDDYMYIMQNVPAPPCCEACRGMCSGFGQRAELGLNNQLRYVRIGHQQVKFTGSAAGIDATRPNCMYKCTCCPCWLLHNFVLQTYKHAFNQYIDNHLEWLSAEEAKVKNDEDTSIAATLSAGTGSLMGSITGSAKVAPSETGNPPSQQSSGSK